MLFTLLLFTLFLLLGIGGLVVFVRAIYNDTYVRGIRRTWWSYVSTDR